MNLVRGDLPDRLAAEYVLGTLRGGARRRFEVLAAAHPRLREGVARWERTLLPMALRTEAIAPAPAVWRGIESRLGLAAAPAASGARAAGAGLLRFWQSIAAVATMAAVVLGVQLRTVPVEAPMVVVLRSTGGDPGATLVAGVSADRQQLSIRPLQRVALAEDRSLELWALPQRGAPVSLGLIASEGLTAVRRHQLPEGTKALAVSVEPRGGSPTGQPTGAVLFAGDLTL